MIAIMTSRDDSNDENGDKYWRNDDVDNYLLQTR